MSPAPALSMVRLAKSDRPERRRHRRYGITLEVEYKLSRSRVGRSGAGTTVDVSSRGVLFQTNDSLNTGSPVELLLNWPFQLGGICPLKLVMHGRVVRSDSRGVAVRIRDHEFRVVRSDAAETQASGEKT